MNERRALLRVLREFDHVRRAQDAAEAQRAFARLEAASRRSVLAAVLGSLLRIQLERPALLPFALAVAIGGLVMAVG